MLAVLLDLPASSLAKPGSCVQIPLLLWASAMSWSCCELEQSLSEVGG